MKKAGGKRHSTQETRVAKCVEGRFKQFLPTPYQRLLLSSPARLEPLIAGALVEIESKT